MSFIVYDLENKGCCIEGSNILTNFASKQIQEKVHELQEVLAY